MVLSTLQHSVMAESSFFELFFAVGNVWSRLRGVNRVALKRPIPSGGVIRLRLIVCVALTLIRDLFTYVEVPSVIFYVQFAIDDSSLWEYMQKISSSIKCQYVNTGYIHLPTAKKHVNFMQILELEHFCSHSNLMITDKYMYLQDKPYMYCGLTTSCSMGLPHQNEIPRAHNFYLEY